MVLTQISVFLCLGNGVLSVDKHHRRKGPAAKNNVLKGKMPAFMPVFAFINYWSSFKCYLSLLKNYQEKNVPDFFCPRYLVAGWA
jgi:hypothetical protein